MELETIRAALGWCTIINIGFLMYWMIMIRFCRDWVRNMHGRWFKLSDETFDAIHYAAMAIFKLLIIVFNLVPYIALLIVGDSSV